MNVKNVLIGLLIAVEVASSVIMGVGINKITTASNELYQQRIELSKLSRKEVSSDVSYKAQNITGNVNSISATDTALANEKVVDSDRFADFQKDFATLVTKYNTIAKACSDNKIEDESINQILVQARQIIDAMSQVNLITISDSELKDIEESIILMSQTLDELSSKIYEITGVAIETENTPSEDAAPQDIVEWAGDPSKDFTITDINDNSFKLSEQAGKVVILTFWASWCSPCVEELPALNKIQDEYSSDEVAIIAINCGEDISKVKSYSQDKNFLFPVATDNNTDVTELYKVDAIPYTVIFNTDGTVDYEIDCGLGEDLYYYFLKDSIDDILNK